MTSTGQSTTSKDSAAPTEHAATADPAIEWLQSEFPEWQVSIEKTATWQQNLRSLWIARRDGHHPQAEFTPAKLHTRLDEYETRVARRRPQDN